MPFKKMHAASLPLLVVTLSCLIGEYLHAQPTIKSPRQPADAAYEVESRRTIPLKDGTDRKLIIEQVKPRVLLPAIPVPATVPVDPAVRAARRTAWAMEAKKERRLLSLTGIYYPNGQTFLTWFTPGPDGIWQTYEAWTLTDFRSAWLVQEFEIGNTIYDIFPSVHPASKYDQRRTLPGPLYFPPGSPGFRLIKGDPSHIKSIEPIAALHEIYRKEGPQLTSRWLTLKAAQEAHTTWLKANPPAIKDIVIRFAPHGKFQADVQRRLPTVPVRR